MSDMLDNYLIAQALGLPWNGWTMVGITIAEIILFFLLAAVIIFITTQLDNRLY